MNAKKISLLITAVVVADGDSLKHCARACPNLRGLGTGFSCTLFEHGLLVDTETKLPYRSQACHDAEEQALDAGCV